MHLGFKQLAARWTAVSILFVLCLPSGVSGSPLLLFHAEEIGSLSDGERMVKMAGGTVHHRFPPRHLIADLPPGHEDALAERMGAAWKIESCPVTRPSLPVHHVWNEILRCGTVRLHTPDGSPQPPPGDMLIPPAVSGKVSGDRSYGPMGAGFWDGSEYLLGNVGVAVILVESDGSIGPSREDWTKAERDLVTAQIGLAAEWWVSRAPGGLLSFTFEYHYDVPVGREPIAGPQNDEALWIGDALHALGYDGTNRFIGTQTLLNDMRERLDVDWVFAVYVVDSSNDEDGMFADGYFAYAYMGGPFMVLTLDNGGWKPENFASVCAHETGHIFYAMDQYYGAHIPCDRESGYLRRANQNSQYGSCDEEEPHCIMRSKALNIALLSETARGQVGWSDSDGDAIPDILDTSPEIVVHQVTEGATCTLTGRATVCALDNRNTFGYGHSITVNTIERVEYRVDDGAWSEALPPGGSWKEQSESFTIEIDADSGEHIVEMRAVNSVGNLSAGICSTVVRIDRSPDRGGEDLLAAVRILGNRPNPFNPETVVYLDLPAAGYAAADIYDVRGAHVAVLFRGHLDAGETALRWDGCSTSGAGAPSGRYFCMLVSGQETAVHPMILIR